MRTPEAATMNRNTARTISAMTPASMACLPLLLADERRGAPDLHHLHTLAGLDDLVCVVGAGGPALALELHAAGALVVVDALGHHRAAAHQRGGARSQLRRLAAVRERDRAEGEQHEERDHDERRPGRDVAGADGRDDRRDQRAARERREEEAQ